VEARPYRGRGDLRAMQRLVQDAWSVVGPKNERHVGDVAWAETSIPGREETFRRMLWWDGPRVVAWAWLHLPATLDFQIDPRRPELVGELLDWFEQEAEDDELQTSALASDANAIAALEERGYTALVDAFWFAYMARDLADIPEPRVPPEYRLRTVGPGDENARAKVHQLTWAPSRVTSDSIRDTMATWPYRYDLDCVAVAPDGSFASYTLVWLDDENRVGEFEPVGTVPDERGKGLARAVNLFALQRLREAGAERAVVMCRGDDAYPIPKRLYESVGFRQHDRGVTFASRRSR
jgi:ribosomal protein S18 acetylase RimI-like enzyme